MHHRSKLVLTGCLALTVEASAVKVEMSHCLTVGVLTRHVLIRTKRLTGLDRDDVVFDCAYFYFTWNWKGLY
ncbi:MAG: hypothetical protein J3R72DRAFT_457460 [Linnemannia gamsii]|nr:MAG: hypothetical protein J3R72DRAFT_457460 [Linnemannia gamsii]